MARNMYGATSADFTLTSGGRVVPGATLTIWSARTGGTQITDLLDVDSVATTTVTSDADGSIVYYGPNNDKTVHWADSGVGNRIAVRPTDITGDPPVLSIGTVGTGAAAASLTGTSEAPVLNLTLPSAGANGVNTAAIQDGAVTSAKIADGTITATDVAASTFAAFTTIGNLLTLNQASGASTAGIGIGGTTLARVSDALGYDGYAIEVTKAGAGNGYVVIGGASDYFAAPYTIPCRPGEIVSATVDVWSPSDTQTATLKVRFKDSGGGNIVTYDTATTLSTSVKTLRNTLVAPANTAYVLAYVEKVQAGSGSESFRYSRASIHKGAAGTWQLPGVPVPGQSAIAVNDAVHLSGTGSPEGVVTAAPGSTWLQTDATTDVKGWIRWIKATGTGNTGWQVGPEADTGLRNLAAESLSNGWAVNFSQFRLRRSGSMVYLNMRADKTSATNDVVYTLPSGFRPQSVSHYFAGNDGLSDDYINAYITSAGVLTVSRAAMSGSVAYLSLVFPTNDAWLSSLPGTA